MLHSINKFLYRCLLDMGKQNSNPVLQVMNNSNEIQQDVKYPKGLLQFSGGQWQAFYHCHTNTTEIQHLFKGEHGHFHIFVKPQNQPDNWSHLVALSMDKAGRPLRWFMVNHWVTGESWLGSDLLENELRDVPYTEQQTLLTQWLLAMLKMYRQEIVALLKKRDNVLAGFNNKNCLNDRTLYLLTEQEINLKDKFVS